MGKKQVDWSFDSTSALRTESEMHPKNTLEGYGDQLADRFAAYERVLRLATLLPVIDISAPTLWRRVKDKSFPQPISLGGRSKGWLQSEVQAWIKERADLRDQSRTAKLEGGQS
jgi:prophage regulatory protein